MLKPLLSRFLERNFLRSFLLQIALVLLTFGTALLLARWAGGEGFGAYAWAFSWVGLASTGALFGLDDWLVKEMAIHRRSASGAERMRWAYRLAALGCLGWGIGLACWIQWGGAAAIESAKLLNWIAWASLPMFVWMHVWQSGLRGLGRVAEGQVAEKFVQPLVFLLGLLAWIALARQLDAQGAAWMRLLSFGAALAAAAWWWRRCWQRATPVESPQIADNQRSSRFKTCLAFMLATLLYAAQTRLDIILLGFLLPESQTAEVGYYNAALRFADVAAMPFVVLGTVSAPMFARLYHAGDLAGLQRYFTQTTRLGLALTALACLGFALLGRWVLGWFGAGFGEGGYAALLVLCGSRLLHAALGNVAYLCAMTGHERAVLGWMAASTLLTLILHLIFIPTYAGVGAAWAGLCGQVLFEIGLAWVAWSRLRLRVSVV